MATVVTIETAFQLTTVSGGSSKISVFEFQMSFDTDGTGYNKDIPAIQLLNAKTPRTLPYGNSNCSYWKS